MKKSCGECKYRGQYDRDPRHYICEKAEVLKRVTSVHRACSKFDKK